MFEWLRKAGPGRKPVSAVPLGFALVLAAVTAFELQTSTLQSLALRSLVASFRWKLEAGASTRVVFPKWGPFDERMGYTRIPEFRRRLERNGYRVARQAKISPSLATVARLGVSPPMGDRPVSGLVIRSRDGSVLYDAAASYHRFQRFDDVPRPIVSALALMEDRGIENGERSNPAVDWGRLSRAAVFSVGSKLGLPLTFQGGSTIAVQIEKYRHSRGGRTRSAADKMQQIMSACLRVYEPGSQAREEHRAIVLDYLNTVPLGGAPGYGEVHGIGEGLRAWFGLDPETTLRTIGDSTATPRERARAYKHVLALLCSIRAPSRMLRTDHADLERRLAFYQARLVEEGTLDSTFARRMDRAKLHFVRTAPPPAVPADQREFVEHVRTKLPGLLGLRDLHELDGIDVEVETTYDAALQDRALELLKTMRNPDSVAALGFHAPRMLEQGDPSRVWYSLLLCERAEGGDVVSVVADGMHQPFDLNTGMRMQLGSTAKLRTMAHYLEIVERLHAELAKVPAAEREQRVTDARDPITRWAAMQMAADPEQPLDSLLARALDREYSASPGETFFTGGGQHNFHNFDPEDDGRRPALRDAFAHSTNLVFIRLMRDVVRWHIARLPYDATGVLEGVDHAQREKMLKEAADLESRTFLRRAWDKLHGAPADSLPDRLLGERRSERRLAMLFYAWNPSAPPESLGGWLAARGALGDSTDVEMLARAYGKENLNLRDYAYLLDVHPLEIWLGRWLAQHPAASWDEMLAASGDASREAQQWLFEPRNFRAQDLRLRILIERDAFVAMTADWKRLGFPFEKLVPSYATAIGSSADRPAALAELMGIITNDGVKRRPITIRKIRFAPGTPYETVLEPVSRDGDRLMSVPVARSLRGLLARVVEEGTARSLAGAFPDSMHVEMGGKTGSGDNRFMVYGRGGRLVSSRAVNRTAVFVFYIGNRYYGVLTAAVDGPESGDYTFTSALPVRMMGMLAPAIEERASEDERIAAAQPRKPARATMNRIIRASGTED